MLERGVHKKAYESGFTLVEIIIVMVIIGIAAGLVGVFVGSGSDKLAVRTLTKEVSAVLRYARNHAASEKKSYSFAIDREERIYKLYSHSTKEGEASNVLINKPIPEGLEIIVDSDDDIYDIEFYPRGNSSGGEIEIRTQDGRGFFLSVNRITGKVEVEKTE